MVLGIGTFLAGIGVIVWVLVQAIHLFADPRLGAATSGHRDATPMGLLEGFAVLLVRILALLVVSLCGSFLATRGIRVYEAAREVETATHPEEG